MAETSKGNWETLNLIYVDCTSNNWGYLKSGQSQKISATLGIRCSNIQIVGIPERKERENEAEKVFKFFFRSLRLSKISAGTKPDIQEGPRTPSKINTKNQSSKHIMQRPILLLKTEWEILSVFQSHGSIFIIDHPMALRIPFIGSSVIQLPHLNFPSLGFISDGALSIRPWYACQMPVFKVDPLRSFSPNVHNLFFRNCCLLFLI